MPASDRRFWWCGGKDGIGHVVGEVVRVDMQRPNRQGSVNLPALYQYEKSLPMPPDDVPPARNGAVIGTSLGMHCTCCNKTYDWYQGEAAMSKLLALITKDV